MHTTIKRLVLYTVGLFFLSLGVTFSIYANLGVSPVSSLAYAFSLTTGLTVGMTTIFSHLLYIMIQVFLTKRLDWRNSLLQMTIALFFGGFIDVSLLLVRMLLPQPGSLLLQLAYLAASLLLVGGGLFLNINAHFTLMPYDELTKTLSKELKMPFGKAKIMGDLSNVLVAGAICLLFLRSFGSIGIGTIVSALGIGKVLGWFSGRFQVSIEQWLAAPTQAEEVKITAE